MLGPSFEQTWIPFTQGCFVPSLVEIGPVILEKKIYFINASNQTYQMTDFYIAEIQSNNEGRISNWPHMINDFVWLLVWGFSSHSKISPWSSAGSLACHTYCYTGHPFKIVISKSVATGIRAPNLLLARRTL